MRFKYILCALMLIGGAVMADKPKCDPLYGCPIDPICKINPRGCP